jgi:hypothetical protein
VVRVCIASVLGSVLAACTTTDSGTSSSGATASSGGVSSSSGGVDGRSATFRVWQSVDLATGAVVDSGSGDGDVALVINPSLGITAVLTATGPSPDFEGFVKDFSSEPSLPASLDGYGEWFDMVGIAEGDHLLVLNRTHDKFYHVQVKRFVGGGENHTKWEITLAWRPMDVAVDDVRKE